MNIEYKLNQTLGAEEFTNLLNRCTLGARRPVDDPECMKGMVENTNLLITAWDGDVLVGVSRSVTDFHFACYLSDLAVDEAYQSHGIGKRLMQLTQNQLGPKCALILLSAPAANDYYPKVGFSNNPRCWVLERDDQIN
jgi:ribosomal protein S18 acetylase RimI-like enzyme